MPSLTNKSPDPACQHRPPDAAAPIHPASTQPDHTVAISWSDGARGAVDLTPFIARGGLFAAFDDPNWFVAEMRILPGGIGLTWPDELDFSADGLRQDAFPHEGTGEFNPPVAAGQPPPSPIAQSLTLPNPPPTPPRGATTSMNDQTEIAGLQRFPLARRGFVMTSLMTGFTLATTVVEAQAIHTDAAGLDAGEVQIPVKDGNLPGYYARPATGTNFPIILVNEEVFGVNEYLQDICRRLAKLGYMAVAPEIYARIGDLSKVTDNAQVGAIVSKKPDAELMSDLDATLDWAARNKGDAARTGEIGFCRGGRSVWLYAAHNPNLKAAVAFYGPLAGNRSDLQPKTALDIADEIKCPLLGLYGGMDRFIPIDQMHEAEAKAKAAGKTVEIVIYPDAPHGFFSDYRPSYQEADAKDGWNRMLVWFKSYGIAPKGAS